jgi:hypothetical protein
MTLLALGEARRLVTFRTINPTTTSTKVISISPGGFYGYYELGVASYLKDNYVLDDCVFSGASAGAWISLFMTYKGDDDIVHRLGFLNNEFRNIRSIEVRLKKRLLENYQTSDFDLSRLFVGVTRLCTTDIYTDFDTLEDAIDCCIASSHIPFITGPAVNIYDGYLAFDGGFSRKPYLDLCEPILHITPSIWKPLLKKPEESVLDSYKVLLDPGELDFVRLYEEGYNDTRYACQTFSKYFNKATGKLSHFPPFQRKNGLEDDEEEEDEERNPEK